jgi:protein-disulfide isomerase
MGGDTPQGFSPAGRRWIELIKLIAIIGTCVFLVWTNWPRGPVRPPLPREPISIEGAALRGDSRAPVVLTEWSDFECPFCEKAERDLLPALEQRYIRPGHVQLAFFHHPLPIHPHAERAAEAAVCAGRQGQFWAMQAALFADRTHLEETSLRARAHTLRLDEPAFVACLDGGVVDQVRSDAQRAEALGLRGTPAFLVGVRERDGRVRITQVIPGAQPVDEFVTAIEAALGQAGAVAGVR